MQNMPIFFHQTIFSQRTDVNVRKNMGIWCWSKVNICLLQWLNLQFYIYITFLGENSTEYNGSCFWVDMHKICIGHIYNGNGSVLKRNYVSWKFGDGGDNLKLAIVFSLSKHGAPETTIHKTNPIGLTCWKWLMYKIISNNTNGKNKLNLKHLCLQPRHI